MSKIKDFINEQTPKSMAKALTDLYSSKEDAMITVVLIKNQTPMYQGGLNPDWKFWDDVAKELYPNSNEDNSNNFVLELISTFQSEKAF